MRKCPAVIFKAVRVRLLVKEDAYVINDSGLLYNIQIDLDPDGETSRGMWRTSARP